jgi:hypothetical protein
MKIFEKLQNLDRRYIYLVVALAIIVPFMIPYNSKTYTTETTESIYQLVDSYAGRPDRAMLISFEHDASTMPELYPMEIALLRQCFLRHVKVFMICWQPTTAPLIDYVVNMVKEEFPDVKSGVDYCNFGFKPIYLPLILGMGDDISTAVETDAEGRNIANLPIMQNIKNYNEMNFVIEFSGSIAATTWVNYARARFGANVAAGVTAVMAAEQYPYIQTGQLIGMMGGLKGAAEYEKLVDLFAQQDRKFSKEIARSEHPNILTMNPKFTKARIGMNAQTVAHVMILVFIIVGNIGFFITRRNKKAEL